jgi:hypothetical protein
MQVVAVSTAASPAWRWRIVNYAGEIVAESQATFPTIAGAVEKGRARLLEMDVVDRSEPARASRSTAHLRRR